MASKDALLHTLSIFDPQGHFWIEKSQPALKVVQIIKNCISATPGENVAVAQGFWMVLEALDCKRYFWMKMLTFIQKEQPGRQSALWGSKSPLATKSALFVPS